MEFNYQLRLKLEHLGNPAVWAKLQPVVTVTILAMYCFGLHLLQDNLDHRGLYQAIVLKHLPTSLTQAQLVTDEHILTAVEQFLDSTYQNNTVLSWKSVLEGPGLRQVILKESPCFIASAPKESCGRVLVNRDAVNTTCFHCWTTTTMNSHICAEPDPKHDGGVGSCVQGCEHGFGFCAKLGATVRVKGQLIPRGGHGLYMSLNNDTQGYKNNFKRLRDLQWLTPNSRYVSVFLTTLSSTYTLARVRLHFLKAFTGQWTMSYDITLGRYPNYFPDYFHDKPILRERPTCDKVLYYFVLGPRDRETREHFQNVVLALCVVLVVVTILETPYFWRLFVTIPEIRWEDHAVLVINLAGLLLHGGLCAGLYVSRVAVINIICGMHKNYGQLEWIKLLSSNLLLCLVLLWFMKLLCLQFVLFECMRVARHGLLPLMIVPFFLVPLIILGGSVATLTLTTATYDLRQAVVTVSWAILGQVRLQECPVVMVVQCVAVLVLLPLAMATTTTTIIHSLKTQLHNNSQAPHRRVII